MKKNALLLLPFIVMILTVSCKKDNKFNTESNLKLLFSADTVMFDTVFSSLGSSTRQLMIYNPFEDNLKISSVKLLGGESSPFRLNLDGAAGVEFYDKEIPANDSLFTFLRVTIDPTDVNNPFVVEDELVFSTNGNTQSIKLLAYGQNVNYIVADRTIQGYPKFKIVADSLQTTYWTNEKPYVIYGFALINSYGTLHIQEGTKIYIHDGGGIWSWSDGQLIIDGTESNPVVIQGDRLEPYYKDQPGQWDRIWLMDGRAGADHLIKHAIIRNGFIGIQAESFMKATQNCLKIENTIIENKTGWGIYAVLYAIETKNTIIANCGKYAFSALAGGDYRFTHGTIANNWSMSTRNTPSVYLRNYEQDSLGSIYTYPLRLEMDNCILYGNLDNEISMDLAGSDTTYTFDHCLLKSKRFSNSSAGYLNCIFNKDPMFSDYNNFDFHLDSILSPAVGMGNPVFANEVPFDLDNVCRIGVPDIGAYQFVPCNTKRR
jgi:hypothetical protein